MADPKFTHLHVHTHYSLLDGANKIPELVRQAKRLGMDSLAITDHGCMFGVVEFFNECKKEGIKPILGMEAYMAPGDRRDKSGTPGETAYHLLLLAQNLEGYHNLLKLSSSAYRDGFYYKPRIDKEILREHQRGLIATSACLGGEIPSAFMRRGKMAEAKRTAETYLDIFGPDRFFIEVQNHIREQNEVNPELEQLAKTCGIGLVATNDVHFLTADDHRVHDVLCCISMGKLQSDESRLKYPKELYLKSPAEMVTALGNYDQAIENTSRIAAMCDLQLDFSKRYAPVYKVEPAVLDDAVIPPGLPAATLTPVPAGEPVPVMKDDERYLRQLCEQGLDWRYGTREVSKAVRDRLDYEITVIAAKSFCSYFLIVWDFCNFARDNGIPVGARGSGVGSMVAFLLGLCNVDPLTYNLLFERFMDPSRNEMPDIDIDICQDGRQRVIDYVRTKYGHVAQIITFGTLAAKAACKDVGRVLGVPLAEIDKLTKLIPATPGMTLKKAIDGVPDLAELIKSSPVVRNVIDYAQKLEGMARNAGCHAAGVIIADQPLDGIVPLYRDSDGNVLTQFEGPIAEKCGLLKMDFLGLRTLTSLTRSIDLERQSRETRPTKFQPAQPVPELDKDGRFEIDKVSLTDPAVYGLFQRGETGGVFQFESGGMRDLLMKMVPDRIEDLIAANALYRPGPMELIPSYCARKHGREAVPQVHPIMDAILGETYGIMCYQEQVMQVFNQLGGIDLSNAYKLIKAISKKNGEIIAKFKPDFLRGTMGRGVSQEKAEEIFDFILKFGGYGFNKCVVGDTTVVDAVTGRRATVLELFHERQTGRGGPFHVHALGGDGKLRPRAVTDAVWNGRRRVYELVTAQGKRITATDNHPFRTLDGWTNLGDLKVGDRVAAPRRMNVATAATMPRHEVVVLAGLLAEGNTCHPSCLYFFGNDRVLVDDFAAAAGRFAETVARTSARADGRRLEVCLSTGRDARFKPGPRGGVATVAAPTRSGAFRWAEGLGIVGLKATEKHVPAAVFELCDADVELFVGRLWAGDGFLANATNFVPFYASSSAQLARDVQTLLLRLGIVSGVHAKRFKYRGGERPGYTVHLLGTGSIQTFIDRVGPHCLGRERQLARLSAYVASVDPDRTSRDTVPADVRTWVDAERRAAGLTWAAVEAGSGVSMKEFYGVGSAAKRGFRRSTVAKLAAFFGSARLGELAAADVFWDRVVSIEPKGSADVYDLTVAGDHNFVADGLVVHNSHSARYAIVAYQTAYMKTYHPVEYMSAVLTYEMGSTEKVVEYIDECRRMTLADGAKGIRVLPPDVNSSAKDFTPVYTTVEEPKKGRGKPKTRVEGVIRFGLAAVRGVGEKAVEAIAAERAERGDYPNLYDFCERVDLRAVNRATVEALAKCGAFASTGANRAQLMQVAAQAFETGQQTQADRRNGQMSMFGGGPAAAAAPTAAALMGGSLPDVPEYDNADLLKYEKELLGFYITSNPLTHHQVNLERYSTASTKEAMALPEGNEVMIGGMIARVKKVVTKNGRSAGQQMAIITLEDLDGTIDGTLFAETFAEVVAKYPDAIGADRMVFVRGKVDKKRETPSLLVNEVIPVDDAVAKLTTAVCVKLDAARHDAAALVDVPGMLARHKGAVPVYFQVTTAQGRAMLSVDKQHGVKPSPALVEDVEMLLGSGSVDLAGAGAKRRKRLEQQRLFQDDAVEPVGVTTDEVVPGPELDEANVD